MPRCINKLFNLAQCVGRFNKFGFEVMYANKLNKKYLSTTFVQKNLNNDNNSTNDNVNVATIGEIKGLIDENVELCDIPADKIKLPGALDICNEDISEFVTPYTKPTFNFAAYANESPTIQELIKLGVELWKLEHNVKAMKILLGRNFDDMKPHIQFLHDCGVPADQIGHSLTINPFIFVKDIDDLHTRIRYLRAHNFTRKNIATIVTNNPRWLNYTTLTIDRRLAFFQRQFKLTGDETRLVAVNGPRLITHEHKKVLENTFCIRELMGFENEQMKNLLMKKPILWMKNREEIVPVFDYLHNVMNLPHEILAQLPDILVAHRNLIKNRHEFLKSLGRVQYNPQKPLYISPNDICHGTDYEFCTKVAKVSIELFDMFLKTR
ncbi:hypothetical protein PV325_005208 [Microctonus aethiopoides]|nr:hypothetical protein PV326_010005 [Microctonus aethiopoides]KAK0085433.1 hypothetical protein PV325_005208 [Microctonus aethiopoides]